MSDVGLPEDLASSFRWVDGHADVWRWFADGRLFRRIVGALVDPFRQEGVTKVAALEARGFLVAGAAAIELGAGLVGVRKIGGALPGPRSEIVTDADYRGRRLALSMQAGSVSGSDRVLVVDDWLETGSQARAARALIEGTGATYAGLSVIVRDHTPEDVQAHLMPLRRLIDAEAFGPSDALPSEP